MKLLTKAIEKKLHATPIGSTDGQGKDAKVIVKFFYPYGHGTWLITEGEKIENDWRLYGAAELGIGFEWGYVMLSSLQSVRKFGRPAIEREMHGAPATVKQGWTDA
jgi:hypothetical protein